MYKSRKCTNHCIFEIEHRFDVYIFEVRSPSQNYIFFKIRNENYDIEWRCQRYWWYTDVKLDEMVTYLYIRHSFNGQLKSVLRRWVYFLSHWSIIMFVIWLNNLHRRHITLAHKCETLIRLRSADIFTVVCSMVVEEVK